MKKIVLICALLFAAGNAFAAKQSEWVDATTPDGFYFAGREGATSKELLFSVILEYLQNNLTFSSGTGDVVGPASSTTGNLPVFTDTTGKEVEDSGYAPGDFVQTETDPVAAAVVGIVKSDGTTLSAAVAGTDYVQTETDPDAVKTADLNAGTDPTADLEEETHASEHQTGGADALTLTLPWGPSYPIQSPTANTSVLAGRVHQVTTLSAVSCFVDPADSGESVVVDLRECDSDGDSCTTVLSTTITCANTETAGVLADTSLAADSTLQINTGTITGTVSSLQIDIQGTYSYAQ